jgi:hypothetical protein
MFSDWVSFLAYPNLFGIKGCVVVVVVVVKKKRKYVIGVCVFRPEDTCF